MVGNCDFNVALRNVKWLQLVIVKIILKPKKKKKKKKFIVKINESLVFTLFPLMEFVVHGCFLQRGFSNVLIRLYQPGKNLVNKLSIF